MNSNEIERIADALHHLRPDWPIKQLRTLLSTPQLADRPRRDVTVALAWVACETASASPYRVLEAGPWWRAAAVEGTSVRREVLSPAERCGVTGKAIDVCRSAPRFGLGDNADDHVCTPDFKQPAGSAVGELRDIKANATAAAGTENDENEENVA